MSVGGPGKPGRSDDARQDGSSDDGLDGSARKLSDFERYLWRRVGWNGGARPGLLYFRMTAPARAGAGTTAWRRWFVTFAGGALVGAVPSGPPEGTLLLAAVALAGFTWISSHRLASLMLKRGMLRDLTATPVGLSECLADVFLVVARTLPAPSGGWFAARLLLAGDGFAILLAPVLFVLARFALWRVSAAACLTAVAGRKTEIGVARDNRAGFIRAAGRSALAGLYLAPAAIAAAWPAGHGAGKTLPVITLAALLIPAAAATTFIAARRLKEGHGLALSDFSPFATRRETRAAIERRAEL